jgi:hypothetical protein
MKIAIIVSQKARINILPGGMLMSGYLARMAEQGFEEVILVHDADSGLKAAIAIHSTARGPCSGRHADVDLSE